MRDTKAFLILSEENIIINRVAISFIIPKSYNIIVDSYEANYVMN